MNELFPSAFRSARLSGQRGFTLVSAIFLLVVLTSLGAAMVTIFTGQQMGFAADLQGTRAYLAARAGIEWGMYQVNISNGFALSNLNSDINPNNTRLCPATTSFVPPAPTLAGFTVTVTCVVSYDPSPKAPASCVLGNASYDATQCGPNVYLITATACNAPVAGSCPGASGINCRDRNHAASR